MIKITIPGLRLRNPLNAANGNSRTSGIIKSRTRKAIRSAVRLAVMSMISNHSRLTALRISVRVTRISPGKLDGWDALPASCKSVIDGIADAFVARDDDPRFEWLPSRQESRGRGAYAVEIEIEIGDPP